MKAVNGLVCGVVLCLVLALDSSFAAVAKWGIFEQQIINTKAYPNKFKDVTLSSTFTAPSGVSYLFRGFYDGDGNGGQSGSVWKIRFMPNQSGTWSYSYSWSDKSSGGSGSFEVVDGKCAGPLTIDSKKSWYFSYQGGEPFHARPYDLHHVGPEGARNNAAFPKSADWTDAFNAYKHVIDNDVKAGRYTMLMVDAPSNTGHPNGRCYWLGGSDVIFDLAVFKEYERIVEYCAQRGIYVFPFDGLAAQNDLAKLNVQFLEYFSARFGVFYNYMGYSPTWEYTEKWNDAKMDTLMTTLSTLLPYPILLSTHDHSAAQFANWQGFSMRQLQATDIFTPNNRTGGAHGGVAVPMDNFPIIGAEDIWEGAPTYGYPQTAKEVRHAAWGSHLAGVMPLYSEWHRYTSTPGKLPGEAEVLRMFDFLHDRTNYRTYRQFNNLVSKSNGQICSGKQGYEYLVYDNNGGAVTIDLASERADVVFSVLWFEPATGESKEGNSIKGGASRTLSAPVGYSEAVLRLQADGGTVQTRLGSALKFPQSGASLFSVARKGRILTLGCLGDCQGMAELFDCRGRQVYSLCFKNTITIDTAFLSQGTYVVALSRGGGATAQYPLLLN